jgi:hypothetical protein
MEAGGMSRKIIRCVACSKRIKPYHPHIGVEDYESGVEFTYHARAGCQQRAAEETAARLERGKVYMVHLYHVCKDEAPGYDCSGGCFAA